ncbi:MAG: hypothetical protein K6E91_01330 [Butyrivibrio sp.]|nr:hypothetical protein [Butyrivibrio sp.]
MKKKIVALLASAAVLAMLAGCGSSEEGSAPSGVEVENIETTEEAPVKEETPVEEEASEEKTEEAQPEGEVDVVLDEGIDKYEGSWYEEIAGRGSMEIGPMGDGKYYIEVNWGSSAAEMAAWRFTALYDSESGDLTYEDGSYQMITFDESGNETVTEEKSVHGVLHLNDEGKLEWTDSAYDSDEPSVFVK